MAKKKNWKGRDIKCKPGEPILSPIDGELVHPRRQQMKDWRVLRHSLSDSGGYSIVDTSDRLIADCYTSAEDAMTMAASRELRLAAEGLTNAESPQEWANAWIALRAALRLAREGYQR